MARKSSLALAVSAALASLYGCTPEPPPFNPLQLQQFDRQAARDAATHEMADLPTTMDRTYSPLSGNSTEPRATTRPTTGPALSEDTPLPMTLQEIVQRAVNNNMDIRVAGYDPAINSNRVVEADAAFDPTFFANPSYENKNVQNGGVVSVFGPTSRPSSETKQELWKAQTGIKQDLQSGGQAIISYNTSRVDNNPVQTTLNPYWENEMKLELNQPLLRNFGTEVNTAKITIARNDQRISLLDFRGKVEETLFNIEQAYWQLNTAMETVRIQEELLRQTVEMAEVLTKRATADITRVQTSQTNQALQSRRAQLVRQKSQVRDLSDKLKQLMNDPTIPVSDPRLIVAASAPVQMPVHFTLKEEIDTGMEHRFELAQQALRIDTESIRSRVAKNNILPKLDLQGSVGAQGLQRSYWDAQKEQDEFNHFDYSAGLQFEVPIGNRSAKAIYQRILLGRLQAISHYRGLIDQVALEVKTAMRNVTTSWDEMISTRQARLAAKDTLEALILREKNNEPLTYSFVQLKLDTQTRLADSARAEVEAIANYNIAVAQLERAKGTLLRYNNVIMQEDQQTVQARYGPETAGAMRNAQGQDMIVPPQ